MKTLSLLDPDQSLRTRFYGRLKRGDKDACWLWTGAVRNGRGAIKHRGKVWQAHRVAYVLAHGEPPVDSVVRQTCDDPLCCNPGHLELLTAEEWALENERRLQLGRVGGEGKAGSKLNTAIVLEIRRLRRTFGWGKIRIARHLGLKSGTVSDVLMGVRWRHVGDPGEDFLDRLEKVIRENGPGTKEAIATKLAVTVGIVGVALANSPRFSQLESGLWYLSSEGN